MMMMMSIEEETNCRNQFDGIRINICRLMMMTTDYYCEFV